jgi:hypothetical protein
MLKTAHLTQWAVATIAHWYDRFLDDEHEGCNNISYLNAILKRYIRQLLGVVWLLQARIHGIYLFPLRLAIESVLDN